MTRQDCIERIIRDGIAGDGWTLVVCRDVPGRHTGGRECWCVPHVIGMWDIRTARQAVDMIERAERPH